MYKSSNIKKYKVLLVLLAIIIKLQYVDFVTIKELHCSYVTQAIKHHTSESETTHKYQHGLKHKGMYLKISMRY